METEVQRLRRYISPLEDKAFTEKVKQAMETATIAWRFHIRDGKLYHKTSLVDLWNALFPNTPYTTRDLSILGRSMQALLWTRTAENGRQVYIKSKEDIECDGF